MILNFNVQELDKTVDALNKLLNSSRQTAAQVFTSGDLRTITSSNSDSKVLPTELYGLLSDLHMKTCSVKVLLFNPYLTLFFIICIGIDCVEFIVLLTYSQTSCYFIFRS